MSRPRILTLFAVMVVVVAIWWLLRSPQDLQIVNVRVMKQADVPLSDHPGLRDFSPQVLARPIARITFQSSADLAGFANGYRYTGLYADFSLCDSNREISSGTSLVFNQSGRISFGLGDRPPQATPEYHVCMDLRSDDMHEAGAYDLMAKPEDVCFWLVPASTMWGYGPKTNVMRIRRETLVEALQRANL